MRRAAMLGALGAALALGGCGGGSKNPSQLWIAPNGDELHVRLQPIMPNPF